MVHCLRALATLAEDLSSGPNTHTVAQNPRDSRPRGLTAFLLCGADTCRHIK